ncbi:MAG: transglycosylase domain-containing protein [Bacillota bacterium]
MSAKIIKETSDLTKITKKGGRKKYKKHSVFLRVLKYTFITLLIIGFVSIGLVGGYIYSCINSAEIIPDEVLKIESRQNTVIYDSNNKQISLIYSSEKRKIVTLDKIPKHVQDAFIAIEDERFWEHNGFDAFAFTRAVVKKITEPGNREGGSTITMQLVKTLTGKDNLDLKRKFQEQYLAVNLESRISKEKVLYLYLNLINFNGVYGVEAASEKYFGKHVGELTIAEGASLAAIIKGPSIFAPTSESGIKKNHERQLECLSLMLKNNFISQTQYDKALIQANNMKFVNKVIIAKDNTGKKVPTRPYFVDNVLKEVKDDLVKIGYSDEGATSAIYGGGIKIYTSMDSTVQAQMNKVFNDNSYFPNANVNGKPPQAAMIIIDPQTGQVRAVYGGHGKKNADFVLNRATDIERQPGSSIKPIAVYGPAIDQKIITAGTVIDDSPSHLAGGTKIYPHNADGRFSGLTPIWKGIQRSVNVIAAKVYLLEGPENALNYLKKVNIDRSQKNISLSLGGMEQGVSPIQMAAAYVPFVHSGIYVEPTFYTKVVDSRGKVILDKTSTEEIRQVTTPVYSSETAYIMETLLQRVVRRGTAYPYGIVQNGRIDSAGKTGTTDDKKDKWFVGFTPYYVGATWYGYDTATAMRDTGQALKLWKAVMNPIHDKLASAKFTNPGGLIARTACYFSGQLSGPNCPSSGNQSLWYLPGTEPTSICSYHNGQQQPQGSPIPIFTPSPPPNPLGTPKPTNSPITTPVPTTIPTTAPTPKPTPLPTAAPT